MSACTTDQKGVEVRTVSVPSPVACVDSAKVPPEPARVSDQLTGNAVHDLAVVSASALDLRAWGETLHALIVPGCVTLIPAAAAGSR